jgi:1,4-alpha-glucan branching enzyme
MIHKTYSSVVGYQRVIFELPASLWADRVFVVGDFNQGQSSRTPLVQERDGIWRAALDLPMGQAYHFHYVVNGERRTDYHADGFATAESGFSTSLIDMT